jgi:hypothetical protein
MAEDKSAQRRPIQWDTEDPVDLLSEKEGHIRSNRMYLTSSLWREMQATWGGVVTHLKTATDPETGEVVVFKAADDEPGAVKVRLLGALNTAEFSFFRPLRKLQITVPPDRQFNVVPYTEVVEGVGTVYVFPMTQRVSVPRNKREEENAAMTGDVPAADTVAAGEEPEDQL